MRDRRGELPEGEQARAPVQRIAVPLDQVGWGVIPLVVVYALSQLISSELSATAAMSKNQRWIMRVLPIGIVFFDEGVGLLKLGSMALVVLGVIGLNLADAGSRG